MKGGISLKKYLSLIPVLVLVALLVFVLSNTSFVSIDGLMRPPEIDGENAEIQRAFESAVGDKYILRAPLTGEYKSSFTLIDLDKDKSDEVVVFYSSVISPDVVRMSIIDKVDGFWKTTADFESAHRDVHKVDFRNIDKDKNLEIIVGWSIFESELSNTLNVYKVKKINSSLGVEKIFDSTYTEFTVCDVNNDKKNDILIFDKDFGATSSLKATYFDFFKEEIFESESFSIDPLISSIYSVSTDTDKLNGNTRIYVDGYRIDSGMTTDVFCWNNPEKSFTRLSYQSLNSISASATRSEILSCSDVDGDSIIEIPFELYIPDSQVVTSLKAKTKQQSIIKWVKYDNGSFEPVFYELFNLSKGYSLRLKSTWFGNFTVKNEPDKGKITFYSYKDNELPSFDSRNVEADNRMALSDIGSEEGNKYALFSVFAFSENEEDDKDNISGLKFLKEKNGYNYYCLIYNNGRQNGTTKEGIRRILIA